MSKPIKPICFVKKCIICDEEKPENDVKMIEEDYVNNNEGKYICIECLSNSDDYIQCENNNCGIVYNTRENHENRYANLCSDCNSKLEEGNLSGDEEDKIDLIEYYND